MTVVLCGVGADTGNVRPVPAVDSEGRFEYVPIPEKGDTAETATYGSIDRRHDVGSGTGTGTETGSGAGTGPGTGTGTGTGTGPGSGMRSGTEAGSGTETLAAALDGIRPGSDGDWITDSAAIRDQPVHHDPNLDALTYGEHRPGYVARLRDLEPGDVVAFYAGFAGPDSAYKHRYLFGYFTVDDSPTVLDPDAPRAETESALADHPENAHAKRFAGHGDLYYHDPDFTDRPRPVVIVPGREPGGLLDRAVRLSDRRRGPNYYMADAVADTLSPQSRTSHGVHLGGFKPCVGCDASADAFASFLRDRS